MNRDWFSQSQPETRGRTQLFLEWFPQVVVDLHEMSGNSTYYFAPPADPLNPLHHQGADRLVRDLWPANARRVRRARLRLLQPRGLRLLLSGLWRVVADLPRRRRHDLRAGLGARAGVPARGRGHCSRTATAWSHHFTAAITTAATAARNREKLLRDFLDYRRSAIARWRDRARARIPAAARRRSVARRAARRAPRRAGIRRPAAPTSRSPSARRCCRRGLRRAAGAAGRAGWCETSSSPTSRSRTRS